MTDNINKLDDLIENQINTEPESDKSENIDLTLESVVMEKTGPALPDAPRPSNMVEALFAIFPKWMIQAIVFIMIGVFAINQIVTWFKDSGSPVVITGEQIHIHVKDIDLSDLNQILELQNDGGND